MPFIAAAPSYDLPPLSLAVRPTKAKAIVEFPESPTAVFPLLAEQVVSLRYGPRDQGDMERLSIPLIRCH
jgi:hypothetical protein